MKDRTIRYLANFHSCENSNGTSWTTIMIGVLLMRQTSLVRSRQLSVRLFIGEGKEDKKNKANLIKIPTVREFHFVIDLQFYSIFFVVSSSVYCLINFGKFHSWLKTVSSKNTYITENVPWFQNSGFLSRCVSLKLENNTSVLCHEALDTWISHIKWNMLNGSLSTRHGTSSSCCRGDTYGR
jgi:hypothetical protein